MPALTAGAPPAASSSTAATAKALGRAEYRILHLVRGLEAATLRAEAAEAKLAALQSAGAAAAAVAR